MKKYNIEILNEMAQKKDGYCLSSEYLGYRKEIKWQCKKNHTWKMKPCNFIAGSWCPKCHVHRSKFDLQLCKNEAKKRGGFCLSKKYIDCNTNMKWRCSQGHVWSVRLSSIRRGNWCFQCYRQRLFSDISVCKEKALSKNLLCLSTKYSGANKLMKWKCKKCSHIWKTTYNSIRNSKKQGCPKCFNVRNQKGNNLLICQDKARNLNGLCLSKKYVNQYTMMNWQCAEKHRWSINYKQIKIGSWCPQCARSKRKCKGQIITKNFIEQIFQKTFEPKFPDWLINNKTKRHMEVDGYCDELKIGFEYQGFQHYKFSPFIHKTEKKFQDLLERDRLKVEIFKKKGYLLLIIKEFITIWSVEKINDYLYNSIKDQLLELDLKDLVSLLELRYNDPSFNKKSIIPEISKTKEGIPYYHNTKCNVCNIKSTDSIIALWHNEKCRFNGIKNAKNLGAKWILLKRSEKIKIWNKFKKTGILDL